MTSPLALIVEDDPQLATIFSEALRAARFRTEVLVDGRSARERLAATEPALVVLDLHLPSVDGTELLDQVRRDPRLTEARVILATADPRLADTVRAQADLVLIKPISFSQLRDLAGRLNTLRERTTNGHPDTEPAEHT